MSGLPRSGSTLLATLLYQNPSIHTEGISALCELMWQTQQSLNNAQAIPANRRQLHAHQMIKDLPSRYYSNTTRPVVIDKCRAWTSPANVEMLKRYVTPHPKIIVLTRDPSEIICSFKSLFKRNDRDDFNTSGMPEEFNRNMASTQSAIDANDPNTFLFIKFDDLLSETQTQLNRVYDFINLQPYKHDLNNIIAMNQEDDSVYGLPGMHDVRRTIGKRDEK